MIELEGKNVENTVKARQETDELRLYIPMPEDGWFYMQMLSDPAREAEVLPDHLYQVFSFARLYCH